MRNLFTQIKKEHAINLFNLIFLTHFVDLCKV